MKEEELEIIKKMPKWLVANDDETFTLSAKGKDYIFEEKSGEVIEQAQMLSEKTKKDYEILLARLSLVEPKLSDKDITELPGSVYMKFKLGINHVYGMSDFL